VTKLAPAFRAEPVVEDVVQAILQHDEHPAVTWLTPTRIRVTVSKVDVHSLVKQTAQGRRTRFIIALQAQLEGLGWLRLPINNRFVFEQIG